MLNFKFGLYGMKKSYIESEDAWTSDVEVMSYFLMSVNWARLTLTNINII